MDEMTRLKAEAAAFRGLVQHLQRHRCGQYRHHDTAGFCRNCLAKWYRAAAEHYGAPMSYEQGPGSRLRHAHRRLEGPAPKTLHARAGAEIRRDQALARQDHGCGISAPGFWPFYPRYPRYPQLVRPLGAVWSAPVLGDLQESAPCRTAKRRIKVFRPSAVKSFIERIERLEEEKKAMGADVREVYSEPSPAASTSRSCARSSPCGRWTHPSVRSRKP